MKTIQKSIALLGMISVLGSITLPTSAQTPQVWLAQLSAEDYFNRGVEKYEAGDLEGAIADYDQAIRLAPNDAIAYSNRGAARGQSGDLEGAIADYDQVIRLAPNDAIAYSNRGITRADSGDKPGGKMDLQQAAELFEQQGNTPLSQDIRNLLEQLQ
jgi:tetratricopeptide (TPR) repeat protein